MLDFFKYARGGSEKRKHSSIASPQQKNEELKVDEEDEEDSNGSEQSQEAKPFTARHRVTARGNEIPSFISSFEELGERYNVSNQLFQNLIKSGYRHPTSIQSHAVPIMMNVCLPLTLSAVLTQRSLAILRLFHPQVPGRHSLICYLSWPYCSHRYQA